MNLQRLRLLVSVLTARITVNRSDEPMDRIKTKVMAERRRWGGANHI